MLHLTKFTCITLQQMYLNANIKETLRLKDNFLKNDTSENFQNTSVNNIMLILFEMKSDIEQFRPADCIASNQIIHLFSFSTLFITPASLKLKHLSPYKSHISDHQMS